MKRVMKSGAGRRTTAWILSAALVFSACPLQAEAEGQTAEDKQVQEQSEQTESTSESMGDSETEVQQSDNQQDEEKTEESAEAETETEQSGDSLEETIESETEKGSEESSEEETSEEESTELPTETEVLEEAPVALAVSAENVTRTCPTIGEDGKVTFHYYPKDGETVTSAYVKGSWVGDWSQYFYMTADESGVWSVTEQLSLEKSYQYGIVVNDNWVGDETNPRVGGNSEILRNPVYNSDGSVSIFYYPQGDEEVKLLYKTTNEDDYKSITMTQDAYHGALLSATVSAQGDYTYCLEVNGSRTQDVNCKEAAFSITKLPEDDASVESPVVNGNKVTFNYYAPTAKSVAVAGQMNGWNLAATPLDYNETTGFWSVELELTPDKYEYKFVIDGSSWVTDPRNDAMSSGNSACFVSGLKGDSIDVEAGSDAVLPATLKLYDENGTATLVEPEYTVEEQYQGTLSVADGKIAIPSTFKAEYFKVIAAYNGYTADVYVNVKANVYTYTIYYLDSKHQDVSSASLWLWSDGVSGTQYYFDGTEKLEDGNTWLKAEVKVPFETLYIIPRAHDDWSWQDVDKAYENSAKEKSVTIYLMNGDTTAYTSIPEAVEKEYRYVIIEYNRPAKDYEGWNIYSWNTGYGSEVTADFKELGGKMVALVPVVDTKESISFCMRRSEEGNPWAEKDGGDHTVAIPLNQTVVKAFFEQGEGVTGNLPYNIGYVTDVTSGTITFYYRDDKLYQNYEEASLDGKVKLVLDGEVFPLTYDEKNERYYYTGKLTEGVHYYGYLVNNELSTDKFNTETTVVDGVTYSAYTYTAFEAELTAEVTPSEIDYNDNAVLKLTLGSEEAEQIEVAEAYADLSELGLSSSFAIAPELMEATIAVKDTVSTGIKNIPVTVKDQYGNLYTTTAQITVKSRESGDFDWDEAVIYFAVTDRFFDGDSSNNDPYGTGTYDPGEGSMYHGGDFAGLEAKLDYLQELGVNTVWITPIVENIEDVFTCDGYDGQHNSGYHGYWASDFTSLNKHLGTEEELQALINALHSRGMKLMVDVVLNHAGYGTDDIFNNTYLEGVNMLRDKSTTVKGDDKKDALSGLPDFVTENAEVRELLVAWQTSWVSKYDIDYFRVDTVKHVDDTTWKAFKNALTYIDPDFKMIGEYAGAGYATSAGQLRTGQMDSLLDFDFNDQAISFVSGNLSSVENFMENRNAGIDNTATVGSFLSSHDEDGLMYRLMNEGNRVDADKAYALMKVAATLQITAKGQPVIYYGEELGQTGANNWPYQTNRYDMNWSIADDNNDMLAHYTKLLKIRNSNTDIFAKGTRSTVKANDAEGILVAARSYAGDTLYVGFNINESDEKQVVLNLKANTAYTDLYSGNVYQTGADGTAVVRIPAAADGGTVVLKAGAASSDNKPQKPAADKPQKPAEDSAVTGIITDNQATEDNEDGSESSTMASTPQPVEPSYTAMDGTVVSGWEQVVAKALDEALAQQVPLASSVDEAQAAQPAIVNIALTANTIKVIPQKVVKQMAQNNAIYVFSYDNGVITAYTSATLAEVKGDLDLNVLVTKDKDFGQGFKSLVLDPRKKSIYGIKLSTVMSLGKENAGKTAFVFQRNLMNNTVEFMDCVKVDELGNIAVTGVDFTDLIVLYQ